jgi:hypothetical protein
MERVNDRDGMKKKENSANKVNYIWFGLRYVL